MERQPSGERDMSAVVMLGFTTVFLSLVSVGIGAVTEYRIGHPEAYTEGQIGLGALFTIATALAAWQCAKFTWEEIRKPAPGAPSS